MPQTGKPFYDPITDAWRLRFKSTIPLLNKDGTPKVDADGKPRFKDKHHLCSGKGNYVRAMRAAARIMGVRAGAAGGGDVQTVDEAIEAWLALHGTDWHRTLLESWHAFAGELPLVALDADHLHAYRRRLDETPTRQKHRKVKQSARTLQAKINVAHRVLRWAHQKRLLDVVPEKPVVTQDEPAPRDVPPELLAVLFATREELAKLYPGKPGAKNAPPFRPLYRNCRAILRFIVETGCRPNEACTLTWKQLDAWGTATQTKHKTKRSTGRNRRIPLTAEARAILEAQPRDGAFVFLNSDGKPYKPGGLRSIMRRRLAALDLEVSPVYALRHSRAQSILEAGYRLEDVAAFLGHKRLMTAERYAQVRADRVRELAEGLGSPLRRA